MSLRSIVQALGGDLYQNGNRANVPAPGHGAADRSVSLMMSEGRVVVHSFGGADWREVLDDLRQRGLVDRFSRPQGGDALKSAQPRPDRRVQTATARSLWDGSVQTGEGGLVARHLQQRGLIWPPGLENLREHPAAPLRVYGNSSRTRRAMIACIRDMQGAPTAVELTYLDPNGSRALDLRVSRKTVGRIPQGSAVRLFPIEAEMLVGEGVVTTLSAVDQFARPGWALLSAGNLARWRAPAGVRDVLIAADRGTAGEAAAFSLRERLRSDGLSAAMVLPPLPWGDWNDVLTAPARDRDPSVRQDPSVPQG